MLTAIFVKFRRRNAITIQDPYPYELMGQPNGFVDLPNSFESSFMLQRMEELQQRLGNLNPYEIKLGKMPSESQIVPPPPSPVPFASGHEDLGEFCGPTKRKIPTNRRQIGRISLHQDLQAITPKSEISLPESILRSFTEKQSNALVLYQPPVNLIEKFLKKEKEEKDSTSDEEIVTNDCEDDYEKMFD